MPTLATPDDAYRYAQGEAIRHPGGFDMQLDRPLDLGGNRSRVLS
ncbi:MAG: DUF3604 domain-containing protein [Pseudomonadales bacterium]|nr:DUF3604 domain-containing protein [Pseudomonadales bacterium]